MCGVAAVFLISYGKLYGGVLYLEQQIGNLRRGYNA